MTPDPSVRDVVDDLLVYGSDQWYARRRDRWNEDARDFVRALRSYEDCHPDDAICLANALRHAEHAAGMVRHAD